MHSRFLELALTSEDILSSLEYYRTLGFTELTTVDAREHAYAVVGDGRTAIGLHQRDVDGPAITFVAPGLADAVAPGPPAGLTALYARLGDDDFHEAGYRDADGHFVTFLEARTYSPPDLGPRDGSLLGYFEALSLPSADPAASARRWERFGFVAMEDADTGGMSLTSDALNMLLLPAPTPRELTLVFTTPDLEARLALLGQRGIDAEPDPASPEGALLRTPEGLLLRVLPES